MARPRKTYTPEFKLAAVKMITEQKLSVAEVARRLGVSQNLLHTWKKAVTKAGGNDGCQIHKVLAAVVVRPPAPEAPTDTPDERADRRLVRTGRMVTGRRGPVPDLRVPVVHTGSGSDATESREGAQRGRAVPNFLARFGRVRRRRNRHARDYLGWCQMAACLIFRR